MTRIASHYRPFSLFVRVGKKQTKLLLKMQGDVVRTGEIPRTLSFLQTCFPQVLHTTCFNEHHFSFKKEVQDTEIGHLYEHIVLAALCQKHEDATYKGWTEWNWKKEPRGTFHISLSIGEKERKDLQSALDLATSLTTRLLST